MTDYIVKGDQALRLGYTTGACATAGAVAAADFLLTGVAPEEGRVQISGQFHRIPLDGLVQQGQAAEAVITKDAGDDPDVTHGLQIRTLVELTEGGLVILGGAGVGWVSLPGLALPVGSAAINPGPRAMLKNHLDQLAKDRGYGGGFRVTISIPGGEEAAKNTMNARLGILGGLSVLGTTGRVSPMSDEAIRETIRRDIDVRLAAGQGDLILVPGNYGADFAEKKLNLPKEALIKCSNYLGDTFDYLRYKKPKSLRLIGHAGKLIKLAAGIMDTHSKMADGRMEILAAHGAMAGLSRQAAQEIMTSVTVTAALAVLKSQGILEPTLNSLRDRIDFQIRQRLKGDLPFAFLIFLPEEGILIKGGDSKLFELKD